MTQEQQALNGVAPLTNVAKISTLVERLKERTYSLPGMGVFYGPAGFGKSYGATWAATKFQAIFVQAMSCTTPSTLCQSILEEMGLRPERGIPKMVRQIQQGLLDLDVPLIIDEVDHLMTRAKIELIRDIYEGSQAPIVLIGEELLPQKLTSWERVHSRVLSWEAAEPGTVSDVRHLIPYYAAGVEIDAELQKRLLTGSRGSIRRICVNLERVRELALTKGLDRVGVEDWGNRSFFDGSTPAPRRGLA